MAPKPDNPGQAIHQLIQGIQASPPTDVNLGQAIHQAIHDALNTAAPTDPAANDFGKLVSDFAQSYDNSAHDLGEQLSALIHVQHD
jgi:hypothetical protein